MAVETIEKKKELAYSPGTVYNYNVITGGKMLVSVIRIGNSRGVRFPKYVLERFGVKDKMDMEVTEDGILLSPVKDIPRKGWAEAFKQMQENNEDILVDIPVSEDFEWEW